MVIQETVVFRCSPETLWQHIEDPEKQKLWMKGLVSNETTTPGTREAGSRFRMVIREGRKDAVYDGEVLVRDRPHRLEVRLTGGNFSKNMAMRVDYRLTDLHTETRLDYTATLECEKPGFFLRLMLKMASVFGRMQLRSFFKTLRTLVESAHQAA
ncbi:MAG: SRPBCC family protein [Gemmataceae bacterium]